MEDQPQSDDQFDAYPAGNLGDAELEHLADFVPQMVWMCTPDGANIYFNRRWVEYTGMTLEESYGAGWNKPFHPEDQEISWEAWDRAVQMGDTYQVESRIRARDGSYRWFLMRGEPFKEVDGRTVKWFGTCTDIHDMKLAEQALLRSEKLASVGRMAVSVSHEINNPLEAVTNLLFLANNAEDISTIRSYLHDAEHELNRIAHITRQALGFYKESSKASRSSVQQLIESAVEIMTSKITAKYARIETRWGADAHLSVVPGELRQVFANLLANSLDAIPGRGLIRIRTAIAFDYQKMQQSFRITIADNGHGIPSHLQNQLFEPLFTTKGTVSTGLGLWVSRQILEKHRASIRVRSAAEGILTGTVIQIFLPVESQAA